MKRLIKMLALCLVLSMTLSMLTACGDEEDASNDNEVTVTDTPKADPTEIHDDTSNNEDKKEPDNQENVVKEYKYEAVAMTNMMDAGVSDNNGVTTGGRITCSFASAVCPKCNNEIGLLNPELPASEVGKSSYLWRDSVCCTNDHDDPGFNGYFDVVVQFILVE